MLGECGGGCEGDGDGDGICDDVDDCVGVVDECGVCNGPGPTEVVIEDIVITYDSVFLPIDNEWFVYAVEVDTTFGYTCLLPIEGCMNTSACNYDELANTDDGSCDYISCLGCTDSSACNFDSTATQPGSCIFPVPGLNCDGTCIDTDMDDVCDEDEVLGCTDETALNYDPAATEDAGNCVLPVGGCTDPSACNYDASANTNDGSCDFESCFGCLNELACNYDAGATYPDASQCDFDTCYGCMDSMACNFDASATYDDGTCSYYGTTTGENPCVVMGCIVPIACNYNPNANSNDGSCDFLSCQGCTDPLACNYEESNTLEDGSCEYESCAPSLEACGDPVSYQGYDYATVLIGDQCWFAENLRSENYENGDLIPSNLSVSEWQNTNSGAVTVYGEGTATCYAYSPDGDACDQTWSLSEYGRLYNWYAVDDARGLCPSGWHVPSDGEWMVLTDHLGSDAVAGGQMKTTYGWRDGGNGTNSSGFSGLPGGGRADDGNFYGAGHLGHWWSSSPNFSFAWYRSLDDDYENVYRYDCWPRSGYSVRCVRDAE